MLVNVNQVLKSLSGETIKDMVDGEAVDATVRMAIVNAVLAPTKDETGMDKVKKYELAKKVHDNDEIDLDEKDISIIKETVGKNFAPIVVGQIFELLKV